MSILTSFPQNITGSEIWLCVSLHSAQKLKNWKEVCLFHPMVVRPLGRVQVVLGLERFSKEAASLLLQALCILRADLGHGASEPGLAIFEATLTSNQRDGETRTLVNDEERERYIYHRYYVYIYTYVNQRFPFNFCCLEAACCSAGLPSNPYLPYIAISLSRLCIVQSSPALAQRGPSELSLHEEGRRSRHGLPQTRCETNQRSRASPNKSKPSISLLCLEDDRDGLVCVFLFGAWRIRENVF